MVTRLYFHATTDSTSGLPTTEQSTQTANGSFGLQSINHVMDTTIGTDTSVQIGEDMDDETFGGMTDGYLYYTKFVSPPLFQSAISSNTWTYNFAHSDVNDSGRIFPIVGGTSNRPIYVNCYVWRPSTSSKVGTILDGDSASTLDNNDDEDVAFVHHTTFSGAAVSSMQDNDVLIFEVWTRCTYTSGINRRCFFSYDGGTENTTDNEEAGAFNSNNHASFIETPDTLVLTPPCTPVSQTSIHKYSIIQYISNTSIHKYNIDMPDLVDASVGRPYRDIIDGDNDGLFVKLKKAGSLNVVQLG